MASSLARFSLPPPVDEKELTIRARALVGVSVLHLAQRHGVSLVGDAVRTKGRVGEAIERALGANAGSTSQPDFSSLGIELKTIPVDVFGVPRESTFVCALRRAEAAEERWESSRVRAKLAHVLWVPIVHQEGKERVVGVPRFWRPTVEQAAILRDDFEELTGLIGVGRIEELTGHAGRWLQVRPKAAHGGIRTIAHGPAGERIAVVPRGFYLRPHVTGAVLRDPAALPY